MVRKMQHIVNWLIRDKNGHIQLVQLPNVPIFGWLIFMILSNVIAADPLKTGFSSLSLIFLAIWAYLEITRGLSYFRRALGVFIAIVIVFNLFQ